jgi:hypothetical protein
LHKSLSDSKEDFNKEVEEELAGTGSGTLGDYLLQAGPEPDGGQ